MLEINYGLGIKFKYKDLEFSVDPLKMSETSNINFVTHAHRDHAKVSKSNKDLIYTAMSPTISAMKEYFGEFQSREVDYKTILKYDGVEFRFIPSGHVLGSYSLDAYFPEFSLRISSDINMQDSIHFEGANPTSIDYLILESTYAHKMYKFPKKTQVYDDLCSWIRQNCMNNKIPVIFAYSYGKNQEIVSVLNQNFNLNIGLDELSYNMSKIYSNNNINQNNIHKINGNLNDIDVIILPPTLYRSNILMGLEYSSKRKFSVASVTGQDFGQGRIFNISDHSDGDELAKYATLSKAKHVYTYHGFSKELAKNLNDRGIKSSELKSNIIGV